MKAATYALDYHRTPYPNKYQWSMVLHKTGESLGCGRRIAFKTKEALLRYYGFLLVAIQGYGQEAANACAEQLRELSTHKPFITKNIDGFTIELEFLPF